MRKIVHLHKRAEGLGVEEFHHKLAQVSSKDPPIPGLRRYVQSHTLVQGYRKGELLFDAVEEFVLESDALADYFCKSHLYKTILRRRQLLLRGHRCLTMAVEVYRVKDRVVPSGAVKNIEFVNRRPGMDLLTFRHYWRNVHGPLGATIPSILRYEQNHLALCAYEGGATPRYDGLAITWFESTAAMRAGAGTPQYEETRADEANFLPDGHLPIIIVREVLDR
ncbi:EthD domain-containing protein [Sinorhizobium sp. GL28]|uniref:EthD domain-containing protein n=1 Tax=Sinorhizobium sp. GL28 TaxID=1358418 RepID=UPI00071CF898|nr:EthD domain-containing protein [Sinorhizobium sp. GL28]KSV87259.1 hypothetical protein N184_31420 [Sinorhizobium sp. GL28]